MAFMNSKKSPVHEVSDIQEFHPEGTNQFPNSLRNAMNSKRCHLSYQGDLLEVFQPGQFHQ